MRSSLGILIVSLAVFYLPHQLWAQQTDTHLPDAPTQTTATDTHIPNDPTDARDLDNTPFREISWKTLPKDFLQDQKEIWFFPVRLAHGEHWLPTLTVTGITAGLVVADPHVMPYFQTHARNLDDLNDTFDATITSAEVAAVPVSLLVLGYARHDEHQIGTAILAGQAYADSAVVVLAMKAITRRKRPSDVPPGGSFHGTFFAGGSSPFKGSSFPSGHAAGVWSVATVVATRYQRKRWVPWLAYSFATVITFSRITSSAHFPSDAFLGAALGFTTARFVVLRPRGD